MRIPRIPALLVLTCSTLVFSSFLVAGFIPLGIGHGNWTGDETKDNGIRVSQPFNIPEWKDLVLGELFFKEPPNIPIGNATMDDELNVTIDTEFGIDKIANDKSPHLNLTYVLKFNISYSDTNSSHDSNYTLYYTPAFITNDDNVQSLKVWNDGFSREFITGVNRTIGLYGEPNIKWQGIVQYGETTGGKYLFDLSIITAIDRWTKLYPENESLKVTDVDPTPANNTWYMYEFKVIFPVTWQSWTIKQDQQSIDVLDNRTNLLVNYTETITFNSSEDVDGILYFRPTSPERVENLRISFGEETNPPFTPAYNDTLQAWEIKPEGRNTLFSEDIVRIYFSINTTIEIVDIFHDNWYRDESAYPIDTRFRTYHLKITDGAPGYIVENIRIYERNANLSALTPYLSSLTTSPKTTATAEPNTYTVTNPDIGGSETIHNGSWVKVMRLMVDSGTLSVKVKYLANQTITMRVLDEARNPLAGARVDIYYGGEKLRFGTVMSPDEFVAFPTKVTNSRGVVVYDNLPIGDYHFKVYYQGQLVKTYNVTTEEMMLSAQFEVVTPVPFDPILLVTWFLVAATITIVGLVLVKVRR